MVKDNNSLPAGWSICELQDCVEILDNQRVPVNSEERKKRIGNIPYYGATGQVGWIDDFLFDEELLLLGEDGAPFFDKSKPISYIITGKSWVNNHAHVLRAIYGLSFNSFLKHYLNQFDFTGYVSGTTRLKLNQGSMNKIPVRLPPLNEQHRIVAKLEKLLSKVDACKERLERIPNILKRFRQSVLAAACSGRLTADWREKNPNVEPVNDILDNIQKIRLDQVSTPTEKKKMQDIYSYKEREDSDLLPINWKYVALDKLCDSFQYGTSKKSEPYGKVAVLRMGNIQNGEINWDDLVYTSDDEEIEKYKLKQGNVLFNRTNSPELVGKTGIYKGEHPAIFAGYLIRINNYKELNSQYLNYCLNTNYAKEYCLIVKTDGVSQSNINAQKLGKFEVPFCPIQEQQEIVRRVEALFKVADQIEERYKKAKAYVDKLTQSILAKAFRGELVPQDPNDEPASALLERIREERSKNQVNPRRKKTKTHKQRRKQTQKQLRMDL